MPNYNNGKIYKIWSASHPDLIYIGSTTQSLALRLGGHRRDYKKYNNGKFSYVTSFKIIELPDHKIELIELFPCVSKMELTRREGYYIRSMDCVNRFIAGRTCAEYRIDNKNEIKILEEIKKLSIQDTIPVLQKYK